MKRLLKVIARSGLFGLMSSSAMAQQLSDVATKGTANIFSLMGLLFAGSSVIGFFLCIVGIMYFRKDRQQPNQGHGGTGMQYLGVGVALLAITFVINVILNSFGADGDQGVNRLSDHGWTE